MRWSVSVVAEGDTVMSTEQIVELADAVAAAGGIASGIGSTRFGAQLIVEAPDLATALTLGRAAFTHAVAVAGLPPAPIVAADAISEAEDELLDS